MAQERRNSVLGPGAAVRKTWQSDIAGVYNLAMAEREQGLKRELTARQMAMVAVGGSIGTGLLLGSGAAIQVAGPAVVVTYVLSALISWTVAMAMGEMSSMHPAAGSFRVSAQLFPHDFAGFVATNGYWVSVVIAILSQRVGPRPHLRISVP